MRRKILFWKLHFREFSYLGFLGCMEKYSLTELELTLILFLSEYQEYNTARDICKMNDLPKSNVSHAVRLLERKGYLTIHIDGDNRKIHRLTLTARAEKVAEELRQVQERFMQMLVEGISPEQMEQLNWMLERTDQNMLDVIQRLQAEGSAEMEGQA